VTISELNIETNRNCIRSQISWSIQSTQIPHSDGIANCDSCVEKNIRPVKKGSKPLQIKKFPRPQRSSKVRKGYIKINYTIGK